MTFRGEWNPNFVHYNTGDRVDYQGQKYEIIQAHTSQPSWAPTQTPALWGHIDDTGNTQTAPYQSGYQSAPQQQDGQYQAPQGDQRGYTADNGVEVTHEETEKHWWDLDNEKRNLLLGGGLAAGVAALGGAYYYNHEKHRKSGEDEQAQAWELQNWILKARNNTADFLQHGPRAPTTWIFSDALQRQQGLFHDMIKGGEEHGQPWYIARAPHNGSLQIGKFRPETGAYKGFIGYAGEAILVNQCEVLIGSFTAIRWVHASGHLQPHQLGARPVEGGRDSNGEPLFVARAEYKGGIHPGKAAAHLGGAYICYGDDEESVHNYEVLCYA